MFTVNPDPISGVRRDGTDFSLYCADDGGYWWITADRSVILGPLGLGLADGPTLDAAFDALEGVQ